MKVKVLGISQLVIALLFIGISPSFAQGGYVDWLGGETIEALSKVSGVSTDARTVTLSNTLGKPVSLHVWQQNGDGLATKTPAALTISTPSGGWQILGPDLALLLAPNQGYFSRPASFQVKLFKTNKEGAQTWQEITSSTFTNFLEFGGVKMIGRDLLTQRLNEGIATEGFRDSQPYDVKVYSGSCKASERHVGLKHDEIVSYMGVMIDLDGVPTALVYEDVTAIVGGSFGSVDSVSTYRLYALRTLGYEVRFPNHPDLQENRIDISVNQTDETSIADFHAGFSQEDSEDGGLKLAPWWYCQEGM